MALIYAFFPCWKTLQVFRHNRFEVNVRAPDKTFGLWRAVGWFASKNLVIGGQGRRKFPLTSGSCYPTRPHTPTDSYETNIERSLCKICGHQICRCQQQSGTQGGRASGCGRHEMPDGRKTRLSLGCFGKVDQGFIKSGANAPCKYHRLIHNFSGIWCMLVCDSLRWLFFGLEF